MTEFCNLLWHWVDPALCDLTENILHQFEALMKIRSFTEDVMNVRAVVERSQFNDHDERISFLDLADGAKNGVITEDRLTEMCALARL